MTQALVRRTRKTIELAEELGYAYREYAHYTLLDRAIAEHSLHPCLVRSLLM